MSPYRLPVPARLRQVIRQQRRSAGATALIVITLTLALGANTAMFSIADALLLRAVPFPAPEQLVAVTSAFPSIRLAAMNLAGPEAVELQALTRTFTTSGPYTFVGLVVQGASEAELANGIQISSGAMRAFGVAPIAGRGFLDQEFARGVNIALLGHGLWTRAFGADPAIVGKVVQLGGVSREIVGIMPEGLTILNRPIDVWLPLSTDPADLGSRSDHRFNVVARLADGRSLSDARADLLRAMEIWREETGEMHVPNARMHPLELQPFAQATTGLNREPIGVLVAAVVFVLLIACANISNLMVARAERRRADTAIHLALGATRWRLLSESLTEGLLLAGVGGLGGLVLSLLLVDLVRATWPAAANIELSLDYRVLAATGALVALAGVLIGLAPILRLDVRRASEALKAGARGSTGPGRLHLQKGLIALQIAMAVLLSGGAGLMVRSLLAITSIDSGFDATRLLRAQVSLPSGSYAEDAQVWNFYDRVVEKLSAAPGVSHAAVMSGLPPQRRANNSSFLLDGNETMDHTSINQIEFVQHVSPGYLATMRIRLLEGRGFEASDDERGPPVALVNETLARRFWPNQSAVGHRLKAAGNIGQWFTVVGVVADVRQNGLQAPVGTELYVPHRQARVLMNQFMPRTMNLIVRSQAGEAAMPAALRTAVRETDPTAAISGLFPMQTVIDRTIAQPRLLAWTFTAFALLALVVAGLGVYAVTSFVVGARTSEFGLRMALGARPNDVLRLVVAGGLPAILGGVALGAGATLATAGLLRNLLFNVEPLDPTALIAGAVLIAAAGFLATVLPARRAARVDPLTALRD